MDSDVTQAELFTQKLVDQMHRYFDSQALKSLRIGIREIIVNAIEHGNLEISFEEKSKILETSDYMEFLLERQKHELYSARKVVIDYSISSKSLTLRITDEGPGFDHAAFSKRADLDPEMMMLEHGRGIIITKSIFDVVQFNEKGNQIYLVKRLA